MYLKIALLRQPRLSTHADKVWRIISIHLKHATYSKINNNIELTFARGGR